MLYALTNTNIFMSCSHKSDTVIFPGFILLLASVIIPFRSMLVVLWLLEARILIVNWFVRGVVLLSQLCVPGQSLRDREVSGFETLFNNLKIILREAHWHLKHGDATCSSNTLIHNKMSRLEVFSPGCHELWDGYFWFLFCCCCFLNL